VYLGSSEINIPLLQMSKFVASKVLTLVNLGWNAVKSVEVC
jgi:hypothetical protein